MLLKPGRQSILEPTLVLRAAAGLRLRPVPDCLPDQAPDDMPRVKSAVASHKQLCGNAATSYPLNDICIGSSLSRQKHLQTFVLTSNAPNLCRSEREAVS